MTPIEIQCPDSLDLLGQIHCTVRYAVSIGAIPNISVDEFDSATSQLKDAALEDYLQELWDQI